MGSTCTKYVFFFSQCDCDCGTLRCEQCKQHAGLTCSVSVFFWLQQTFACSLVDVHKIHFFVSLNVTAIVARAGVSNASKTLAGLTCSVSVFLWLQQTFACSLVDVHKIRFFCLSR